MARLLIVEDDRITALALQRKVTQMGHTVVARVASAAEAMAAVQAERPDAVLLDIGLSGPQDGLSVGLDIQTFWATPVIYLSGSNPTALGLPEFPEALWCYIAKPIDWEQLRTTLARLFPTPPPQAFRHPSLELREQLSTLRQPMDTRERPHGLTDPPASVVARGVRHEVRTSGDGRLSEP
jgi:DNA-binding NtrC family response regulator